MQTRFRIPTFLLSFFAPLVLLGNLSFCAQDFPADPLKDPSHLSFWIFWECALKGDCKFDPSRPTERYFVFVNAASGSDSAAGTRAEPLQSIAAAVLRANTLQKRAVAVCAGSYNENALVLSLPISIYGSYNCASWTRSGSYGYPAFDGTNSSTILAGGYSASNTASLTALGGAISRSVVIDGFVIQGAASGANGSIGLRIASGASPTVLNNQINGGSATGTSKAISMESGDAYIANNRINGGGSTMSYGIYASSGAKGSVWANESISGGSGGTTYGIYATGAGASLDILANTLITGGTASSGRANGIVVDNSANATIANNTRITAGTSNTNNAYGIYVMNAATATISGNLIDGGNTLAGTTYSLGIEVWNGSASATIEQNRIFGGNAASGGASIGINFNAGSSGTAQNNLIHGGICPSATRGIQIWNTSATIYIYNNTILAGNNASASSAAINVGGGTPSPPTIQNNILFCAGGVTTYGLSEDDATSDPGVFQNNNIFDCTTALYRNENATNLTTSAAINALSDMTASGNISVDMVGGPAYFGNVDGADASIDTMADNDWSLLSSTPASISQGGLDLFGLGVTEDFSSATRTAPFSIGAYELD